MASFGRADARRAGRGLAFRKGRFLLVFPVFLAAMGCPSSSRRSKRAPWSRRARRRPSAEQDAYRRRATPQTLAVFATLG